MTRANLIQAIFENEEKWSCPYSDCADKPTEEYELNDCIECAEKLLSEYEQKIRADAIDEFYAKCREKYWFSSDFMNFFEEIRKQLKEQNG